MQVDHLFQNGQGLCEFWNSKIKVNKRNKVLRFQSVFRSEEIGKQED